MCAVVTDSTEAFVMLLGNLTRAKILLIELQVIHGCMPVMPPLTALIANPMPAHDINLLPTMPALMRAIQWSAHSKLDSNPKGIVIEL